MSKKVTKFPTMEDIEPIEVVKISFRESCQLTWKELFSGFDRLYAITFSYGINFIEKVMRNFTYGEVILGCNALVKFNLQTIMAYQSRSIQEIQKYNYLVDRIKQDDLTFYVSKDIISHEKIFILEANNGNTRVITGSANFSEKPFSGNQLENIEFYDNDPIAFAYYYEKFQLLKDLSTSEIVKEAIFCNTKDEIEILKNLPILKETKMSTVGIIIEEKKVEPEKADYLFDVQNLSKKYDLIVPKKEPNGKILLTAEKTVKMLAAQKKIVNDEKEKRAFYPQFVLDYNSFSASLNGKIYNLAPSKDAIKSDLEYFVEYFNGFDQFEGDILQLKAQYFKIFNYMFLSPFIAFLRYHAYKNDFPPRIFPLYAVLCGKSDAGKSAFVETVHYFMFGKKIGNMDPASFVKTSIYGLLRECQGIPPAY